MQKELIYALKEFGISDEIIKSHEDKFLQMPVDLVGYEGQLPLETQALADARKECADVYIPGREKKLAKILYKIDPDKTNKMLPWEVIIYYHNSISDLLNGLKVLADAEQLNGEEDMPRVENNEPIDPTVENDTVSETDSTQTKAIAYPSATREVSAQQDTTHRESAEDEIKKQVTAECDVLNKEKDMSNVTNEVQETANGSAADAVAQLGAQMGNDINTTEFGDVDSKLTEGGKTKASKPEKLDSALQNEINRKLTESRETRLSVLKNEHIDKLVSSAPSVLDRLVSKKNIKGKLVASKGDGTTDLVTKIDAKLKSIINKCFYAPGKTSKSAEKTYEDWLKLPDDQKYANVVPEDVEIAKKIVELLLQAKDKPDLDVDLLPPEKRNVNFKGLRIANSLYSKQEVTIYLSDKTFGATYTADSYDAEGKEIPDKLVKAQIKLVSKKEKTNGVNSQTTQRKSIDVTLKGRDKLVDKGLVEYIFPNVNKDTPTTTPLTVAIGKAKAAFRYYQRDDNGVIQTGEKGPKNAKVTYNKTRTATLRGVGACYAVVKEFAPDIQSSDSPSLAANRWAVKLAALKEDTVFLTDMANSPIYKIAINADVAKTEVRAQFFENVRSMINKKDEEVSAEFAETYGG